MGLCGNFTRIHVGRSQIYNNFVARLRAKLAGEDCQATQKTVSPQVLKLNASLTFYMSNAVHVPVTCTQVHVINAHPFKFCLVLHSMLTIELDLIGPVLFSCSQN